MVVKGGGIGSSGLKTGVGGFSRVEETVARVVKLSHILCLYVAVCQSVCQQSITECYTLCKKDLLQGHMFCKRSPLSEKVATCQALAFLQSPDGKKIGKDCYVSMLTKVYDCQSMWDLPLIITEGRGCNQVTKVNIVRNLSYSESVSMRPLGLVVFFLGSITMQ